MPLHPDRERGVSWFTFTAVAESVGDSLSRTILPIVAVTVLGAGTGLVGVLQSLGLLAFLVLSVPVGVWADRRSAPLRMMTASSLARAFVVALGAAAWWFGWLEGARGLALLLAMAAVIGVADVGYTSGQGLLVPRLVEQDAIRALFGRVQATAQAGGAAGPLLLSGLLLVVSAPAAWIAAAVAYVVSVLTQTRIQPAFPAPEPSNRSAMLSQARAGWHLLWQQPTLARITSSSLLMNAAVTGGNTLLPVIALSHYGIGTAQFATLGAVGAVAGIVGAAGGSALTGALGLRATRLICSAVAAAGVGLVMMSGLVVDVLPGGPFMWLLLQAVLASASTSISMVAGSDLPARLSPPDQLGTVMGAQRAIVLGIMPVSALLFGAAGAVWGLGAATWGWLTLAIGSAIPCLRLEEPDG